MPPDNIAKLCQQSSENNMTSLTHTKQLQSDHYLCNVFCAVYPKPFDGVNKFTE